jgi:uncharacterized membrane protein
MYALHPATIHFPVALLLLNFVLTGWAVYKDDPFVERAAYGALLLGWLGAAGAILSGLLAAALVWPVNDDVLAWLNTHAALGLILLLVYGRALLWRRREPQVLQSVRRRQYLALLVVGALLVALDGWVGGHMVYRLGVGVR